MKYIVLAAVLFSSVAVAHDGRVNKWGCHRDRTTGSLHCHSVEPGELEYKKEASFPGYNFFKGSQCQTDCSGHIAGYAWAKDNELDSCGGLSGNSSSFVKGCELYIDEASFTDDYSICPQNASADTKGYCHCDAGFSFNNTRSLCLPLKCPTNGYAEGNECKCNEGFKFNAQKTSCLSTAGKKKIDLSSRYSWKTNKVEPKKLSHRERWLQYLRSRR